MASRKALVQHLPAPEGVLALQSMFNAVILVTLFLSGGGSVDDYIGAFSNPQFRKAWVCSGFVNMAAAQLLQWGFKKGELGDISFLSLTPCFLLVVECLANQEGTSAFGVVGVVLISGGGFLLGRVANATKVTKAGSSGFLNAGAGIFTFIAMIYTVSSYFDRQGVQAAPPLVYGSMIQATTSVGAVAVWLWKGHPFLQLEKGSTITTRECAQRFVEWSLLAAASYFCHLKANGSIPAYVVNSIRSAQGIVGLLLGRMFFGEEIGAKLFPVSIMILGVCSIALR